MPKNSESTSPLLQYGGQAVIEGVMMRSRNWFAVACRAPSGEIVVKRENIENTILGKLTWLNVPFLRGTLALVDAMALGMKALSFASKVQLEGEEELKRKANEVKQSADAVLDGNAPQEATPTVVAPTAKSPDNSRINDIQIGGSMVIGLSMGLGLFVLLPTLLTGWLKRFLPEILPVGSHAMWLNVADGLIRMVFFFGYITLISQMDAIRRVFMYHGAEHKAINTLEAGSPLDRNHALQASRIHPRCGTSFIFIVLVINLIVFMFLPRPEFWLNRFFLHLAVIPIVAGLSFELIKFAGKFRRNGLVIAVFTPGMWSQYLTTREPDGDQVDVALAALYSVLEAEGHLAMAQVPQKQTPPETPEATTVTT